MFLSFYMYLNISNTIYQTSKMAYVFTIFLISIILLYLRKLISFSNSRISTLIYLTQLEFKNYFNERTCYSNTRKKIYKKKFNSIIFYLIKLFEIVLSDIISLYNVFRQNTDKFKYDTVFIDNYECVSQNLENRIQSISLILIAPVIISTFRSAANLRSLMGVVRIVL